MGYGPAVAAKNERKWCFFALIEFLVRVTAPPIAAHDILIVEDDDPLRDAWVATLTRAGYRVRQASNATDAIAQLRVAPRPQLVLLDLGLPPRPGDPSVGLALLRQLLLEMPSIKVLVLTGQDEPAISWEAISAGAFDFLIKPVSRAQVVQSLDRAKLFLASERQLADQGQARIVVTAPLGEGVREFGEAAQERLVRAVMEGCQHNVAEAARLLGLSRENLYYFIRKFGIERQVP